MLTYEDCADLSDLTGEEIDAIAEHENIPRIIAVELGHYLLEADDGVPAIKKIILDDLNNAQAKGDAVQTAKLKLVLQHFVVTHPQNKAGA
ncbi:MAG: hypothetical protein AB1Y26_11755 [Cycloclasticus sp.]|nr:hypothetical protein A9Q85_03690 [Cycloclasticus sp. 44_32_T64]